MPSVLAAPGESLDINDSGQRRTFTVATDVIASLDRSGRLKVERITPGTHLESVAARKSQRLANDRPGLILYPDGAVRDDRSLRVLTEKAVVTLKEGSTPATIAAIAAAAGATSWEQPPYFKQGAILTFDAAPAASLKGARALRAMKEVVSADPLLARQRTRKLIPNDPFFAHNSSNAGYQWHLRNTGQNGGTAGIDVNVSTVWDTWRGSGIRIGIIDDGLAVTHPDLAVNVDTANDYDYNGADSDPSPESGDDHGTACAGVAAARGNNNTGVSGAAPEATLVGLRLIGGPNTDDHEANAFAQRNDIIQIKSNSWGPDDDGDVVEGPGPLAAAALANATNAGRGGLGTVFLWAAGNGLSREDDSNFDGYANSIHTIAVSAIGDQGTQARYSEPGANVLIASPSGGNEQGITTTDLMGFAGYNSGGGGNYANADYTNDFSGTSSATPLAAGCVALLLQSKPTLGWRDVKEILARSASLTDEADPGWFFNGAGLRFNDKYGAGRINAAAAVALAADWTNLPAMESRSITQADIGVAIPDNSSAGVVRTLSAPTEENLRVEQLTLSLNITHPFRGELEVLLTSPSGATSRLIRPRPNDREADLSWTVSTPHFWGERSAGNWRLQVNDTVSRNLGTLNSAAIRFYGTRATDPVPPPFITSSRKASGRAGSPFSYQMLASHSPVSWNASGLPPGLSISPSTGLISGTPTVGGTFSVHLTAANGSGDGTAVLTLSVIGPDPTLADAVESPGPALTTEGDGLWTRVTSDSADGVDSARSGAIPHGGTSRMETTVTGPLNVSFQWKVSSDDGDRVAVLVDEAEISAITGDVNWTAMTVSVPAGAHSISWRYTKDATGTAGADAAWVDSLATEPITAAPVITSASTATFSVGTPGSFRITATNAPTSFAATGLPSGLSINAATGIISGTPVSELAASVTVTATNHIGTTSAPLTLTVANPAVAVAHAVGSPSQIFTFSGDARWFAQESVFHEGGNAAQSGPVADQESSILSTVVTGPAELRFWWNVSSENGYDFLSFLVDGVELDSISGEPGWRERRQAIGAGNHLLQWKYQKDSSFHRGADAAWVDSITLERATAPPVITSASTASGSAGVTFRYQITASQVPFSFTAAPLPPGLTLNTSTGLISGTPTSGGTFTITVSAVNSFGTGSAPLVLTIGEYSPGISLALDIPVRPFTYVGAPWFSQSAVTQDGMDAVQSGAIDHGAGSTLRTTVTGPVFLRFWWKVSSEENYDFLRFSMDGREIAAIDGERDWVEIVHTVPAGPHTITWMYEKDGTRSEGRDAGWIDGLRLEGPTTAPVITSDSAVTVLTGIAFSYQIEATQLPTSYSAVGLPAGLSVNTSSGRISGRPTGVGTFIATLTATNGFGTASIPLTITVASYSESMASALDLTDATFTAANTPWLIQSAVTHDGVDAAQSADIGDAGTSTLRASVTGPGIVKFWWKVSSEEDFDFLHFRVGGFDIAAISGEQDWAEVSASIPAGRTVIEWRYQKDSSADGGADAGWVDDLRVLIPRVVPLTAAGLGIGFQEPALAATTFASGAPGSREIGWSATAGAVAEAGNRFPALTGSVIAGTTGMKSLVFNGRSGTLYTDVILLDGFINTVATADVRTYTTSTSGFETSDNLGVRLEVSENNSNWSNRVIIMETRSGGSPDNLINLTSTGNDVYTRFTSSAVPLNYRYARFAITAVLDSPSEFYVIDNLRLTGEADVDADHDGYPSRTEAWFGTSDQNALSSPVATLNPTHPGQLSFPSVSGRSYSIWKSPDLRTWTSETITATSAATDYTDPSAPVPGARYYRVLPPP